MANPAEPAVGDPTLASWADLVAQRTSLSTGALSSIATAAANWAITSGDYRRFGTVAGESFLYVWGSLTYSSTTITADANGDVTNTNMATLNAGFRPPASWPCSIAANSTAHGGAAHITSGGLIQIESLLPNKTIVSGGVIVFAASYPI